MSFNNEARKVRDASLPYGQRYRALGSAVQLYRPIGFTATWLYLEHRVGRDLRRDGSALIEAVELLAASRAIRNRGHRETAAVRRAEKLTGRRSPGWSLDEVEWARCRWHGDEAAAARFALAIWRRDRPACPDDGIEASLRNLVDVALDAPNSFTERRRRSLDEIHDAWTDQVIHRRDPAGPWQVLDGNLRRVLDLRTQAWFLAYALDGPDATLPGTLRCR